jgi:putative multiple sugar transport system substrate-binding protein
MSLLIDTKALAKRAVELTDDILMNRTPANLNNTRFNNGEKIVPTSICKSVYVDIDTYTDVIVNGGIWSEEDLK